MQKNTAMVSVLITAGSTREYIDPVRYITSGSSGKQGYAFAEHMGKLGWDVKLVSCPVSIVPDSSLYSVFNVHTSAQMLQLCLSLLPVDVAIFTAAITDWIPHFTQYKLKKQSVSTIALTHSPDILKCVSIRNKPKLLIGCCLESDNLIESAKEKLVSKRCNWMLANSLYIDNGELTAGSDYNKVSIVTRDTVDSLELMTKKEVARLVTERIAKYLKSIGITS